MNDIGVIHLRNGGFTIVDSVLFPLLVNRKWTRTWDGYVNGCAAGKAIGMGRFIKGIIGTEECDHKNGCRIDNTLRNLRRVTFQQNQWNQGKRRGGTSKYKGVFWCRGHSAWRAQIRIDGKKIHLGSFHSEELAALKYNEAATKYFGEFAKLNAIEQANNPVGLKGKE